MEEGWQTRIRGTTERRQRANCEMQVVFKALIVVHLMIREGEHNVTLVYLRKHPRLIAISNYSDGQDSPRRSSSFRRFTNRRIAAQQHGGNIKHYANYLYERARSYGEVQTDYVRFGEGRLRKLGVDKGLLREVENVQQQLRALLKCRVSADCPEKRVSKLTLGSLGKTRWTTRLRSQHSVCWLWICCPSSML